ncbi:MAG: GGDEF domain-containing protein [Aliarcobacter sp.]|nr:GGDEF domain-containing protein [Aliarcobacter sp.]
MKLLIKGEKWTGEFINVNKYDELYYETASITPIITDNEIIGYLAIKLNITDYIKEQEKVEFLAYHDNLTLLPNRRSLERKLNELIAKATRRDKFAVLFLDLDGFKIINDTLGHDIGDLLLKEIAKKFHESLRINDYVFRLGGDEFAIIIEYSNDIEIIEVIAKKIIDNINKNINIRNNSLHVGCSIGIAKFPQDGVTSTNLLKYSDIAMYKAKQNGRNRFEFYTKDLSDNVHSKLYIE